MRRVHVGLMNDIKHLTRRRVIAAALAVAVAGGAVYAFASGGPRRTPQAPPPGTPALTVMTYNVNFGIAGDAATIDVIRAAGADLVLLQETNRAWERALRRDLALEYPHMRFEDPSTYVAGGMGVLSKRPILVSDSPVPSPVGWFFGWRVEVDTALGRIQVLNVHLRPPLSRPGKPLRGYFATRSDRVTEMRAFLATLKPGMPALIAGDFNEDDDGAAVDLALDRGMDNALPPFHPQATTWRWPVGSFTARTRLDHILYEDAVLHCYDAKVLYLGSSDHFPVVAGFVRN